MGKYGIYSVGDTITQGVLNSVSSKVNGCRFRYTWAKIETSDGVYDFTEIEASVMVAYNTNKYIWLQFLISPCKNDSSGNPLDYNCPAFLFSSPYNVPKVFTSTSGTTLFYPYYLNSNFINKQQAFLDAVYAWIASLSTAVRAKIVLVLSSEGKTGDPGPYNGTPTNPAYVISNDAWNTHKYNNIWIYQLNNISIYGLSGLHFMINPGNDGENLQRGLDLLAEMDFKNGDNSHNFDFNGSVNLSKVFNTFRDPASAGDFQNIGGGEFENTDEASYYTSDPKKYLLPFVCFNLAAGSSIITIAPAKMISDSYAYDLFNEFADIRNITDADKGLILFRDRPDFDDTVRFPESIYGPVIDPARLAGANGYTQKYNQLMTSGKPDALIADNLTSLRVSYFNPARETAIVAAVPGASHTIPVSTNRDYDVRNENFGFDVLPGNFERYVSMYDPVNTSVGGWNIGPLGFHGLYTRKLTTAKSKWYFRIAFVSDNNYQVTIKINYYNGGAGQWQLFYYNGTQKVSAGTVVTTNTDAYIEKIFTISDFQGGKYLTIPGQGLGADFTIEKLSGDDIHFSLMKVYRIAQNTTVVNHAPVPNAGTDQTLTAPIASFTLSGSATDIDGDDLFYNWVQTSGPACEIVSFTNAVTNVTGVGGGNVAPGTYVFSLKVLDAKGALAIDSVTIVVDPEVIVTPLPPVAIIEGPATGNINEVLTFDGSKSFDDDSIVSYAWSVVGPIGFTIDDLTAAIINFTGLYTGTYILTLIVTDTDSLTDERTFTVTLSDPDAVVSPYAGLPGKKFQYYLINENGISYYIENGVIKTSSVPRPLDYTPDGWQELLIKWERNAKYWGINRNVTNQLSFVIDGAKIIRNILYKNSIKGLLYLLIQKRVLEFDEIGFGFVYRFLYKGQLDLSTFNQFDIAEGKKVKVNIAEGDFSKYLKSFENQIYEIPCNADAEDVIPVWIDGPEYYNKINFTLPDFYDEVDYTYTLPLTFINEEGDSFLLYKTSQQFEVIGTHFQDYSEHDAYTATSGNFFFAYPKAVTIILKATITFKNTDSHTIQTALSLETSLGNKYYLHNTSVATLNIAAGLTVVKDIDMTISLAANEKLFLILDHIYNVGPSSAGGKLSVVSTDFNIQVQTRLDPSLCYAMRLSDLFSKLVTLMSNNTYTTSSDLFEQYKNFVITSGNSIRGFDTATIKTSMNQLFSFANAILAGGLSYALKNVEIESRSNYFDNSNPISLGIVKNVKFSIATDYFFSTLKIGYENQTYESVNGRQEFNTTSQYTTPISELSKELSLKSDIRADAYGIETVRIKFFQKDTTDAQSDNDTFVLDVEDEPQEDGYYHLKRFTHDSVTGINSPTTMYNEQLRPRLAIERNGALLRSMFWNMEDQLLTFQTSDKNQLLTITDDGVTKADNEDLKASRLDASMFIPIIAEIDPAGLWNLVDLLNTNPNRCFSFIHAESGETIEGFNLSVALAPNDRNTQTFRLLLTTNNNVQNLI